MPIRNYLKNASVLEMLLFAIVLFVVLKSLNIIDPPPETIQLWQGVLPQVGAITIVFYALKSEIHKVARELEIRINDKLIVQSDRIARLEGPGRTHAR